jgi:hypothetical protein
MLLHYALLISECAGAIYIETYPYIFISDNVN